MRRLILPLLVAALCCGTAATVQAAKAKKPNILVILADDLGYSDLGCYGGEIPTPHIDALAKRGVRFTQVYNSARCCPSRASLMTGLYPTQAGIGDFTTANPNLPRGPGYLGRLRDDCVTLAEVLKPAGYGCYYVGKWHLHDKTGPIRRGFDEFYGYTFDHSHDQYDADYYIRLPQGRAKEINPPRDEFYATDVFNDYALEFIRQGQQTDKPWFLFLGHSSPHFPIQAPAKLVDKYEETYTRGWDVLREERFERMKKIGLIDGERWSLTPRSIVPVDRDDIANDYSGQQNPAWDSLDEDRQHDLARRMAVFAAMVEGVDNGVGRIVDHLQATGDLDNTLILFLTDNGACYEWGPFGFDGVSRVGRNDLRTGDALREIGQRGTHQAYGSGWANLGNTPFRMYKHFTHEGGISMPLIAHWPAGIGTPDVWVRQPGHMMDIMPTLMEAGGAAYPTAYKDQAITPLEGTSLLPAMRGKRLPQRQIGFDHQAAHALREGDWKIVWSKRMPHKIEWELYNLAEDRCETNDLAAQEPERLKSMVADWEKWAWRVGVHYDPAQAALAGDFSKIDPNFPIAKRPWILKAEVEADAPAGVIVAQGGNHHGYALHVVDGRVALDVRINGKVTRLLAKEKHTGKFRVRAELNEDKMSLQINDEPVVETASPGLIPEQPLDELSLGHDANSAAGDYESPNALQGKLRSFTIKTPAK